MTHGVVAPALGLLHRLGVIIRIADLCLPRLRLLRVLYHLQDSRTAEEML